MSEFVKQLLIVCPLLFLAGMCDAIAGGGGTISLPAFLLAGLPTHFALGTNKMCMSVGTAVAVGSGEGVSAAASVTGTAGRQPQRSSAAARTKVTVRRKKRPWGIPASSFL